MLFLTELFINDWIYTSSWQWLLSPDLNYAGRELTVKAIVNNGSASNTDEVRPTIYLASNVKITGGNGSLENPYTLG